MGFLQGAGLLDPLHRRGQDLVGAGDTWTEFANRAAQRGVLPGCLDLIEPVASFTADGRLLAFCRPIYSPTMWQATSYDAAETWDAVAIGPFPGYSAGMICTSSGALLVAHRFPNTTIHTSLDGGRSWDAGTGVDWPVWASGKFVGGGPGRGAVRLPGRSYSVHARPVHPRHGAWPGAAAARLATERGMIDRTPQVLYGPPQSEGWTRGDSGGPSPRRASYFAL